MAWSRYQEVWLAFGGSVIWLVFKAHRLVYHSTLGLRVIKKKKAWSRNQGVWLAFEESGSEEGSYSRLIDFCITRL